MSNFVESLNYYLARTNKSDRNINLAKSLMAHVLIQEGEYQQANELLQSSVSSVMKHYGDTLHKDIVENDLQILKTKLGKNYEL